MVAGAAIALTLTPACGQQWACPASGLYFERTNWVGSTPCDWGTTCPGNLDQSQMPPVVPHFQLDATYSVHLGGTSASAYAFDVGNGDVTFDLGGATFSLCCSVGGSRIAANGGCLSASGASLTVSDGLLSVANELSVGAFNAPSTLPSTLRINPGASLAAGYLGVRAMAGPALADIDAASASTTCNSDVGPFGLLTVRNGADFAIGCMLAVSEGGVASFESGSTGQMTNLQVLDATLAVNGAGTTVNVVNDVLIRRTGLIIIEQGAAATTDGTLIGNLPGLSELRVDGEGSIWTNHGAFQIGRHNMDGGDFGLLRVRNGALVITDGALTVGTDGGGHGGSDIGGTGTIELIGDDSLLSVAGSIYLAWTPADATNQGVGLLSVGPNAQVQAAAIQLGARGTIGGSGTFAASVVNRGLVSPGASAGTMTVTGGFTQTAAGRLTIELVSPSEFDTLLVQGAASLGGTLEVSANGQVPCGDFDVLVAGSVTGSFSTVTFPILPPDWQADVEYLSDRVRLILGPSAGPCPRPCDPDVNCDGAVNGFDIQATEEAVNGDFSNFCQSSADLNGDGSENGFDIETEEQRVNGEPC